MLAEEKQIQTWYPTLNGLKQNLIGGLKWENLIRLELHLTELQLSIPKIPPSNIVGSF